MSLGTVDCLLLFKQSSGRGGGGVTEPVSCCSDETFSKKAVYTQKEPPVCKGTNCLICLIIDLNSFIRHDLYEYTGGKPVLYLLEPFSKKWVKLSVLLLVAVPPSGRGTAWDGQHTREEQ